VKTVNEWVKPTLNMGTQLEESQVQNIAHGKGFFRDALIPTIHIIRVTAGVASQSATVGIQRKVAPFKIFSLTWGRNLVRHFLLTESKSMEIMNRRIADGQPNLFNRIIRENMWQFHTKSGRRLN